MHEQPIRTPAPVTVARIPQEPPGMEEIRPGKVLKTNTHTFIILGELGRGGSAVAVKAVDLDTAVFAGKLGDLDRQFTEIGLHEFVSPHIAAQLEERPLPLCVLKLLWLPNDHIMVRRMRHEAAVYVAIRREYRHESLPIIYAGGFEPIPYIALEYIPGQTLADVIEDNLKRGGRMAWRFIFSLFDKLLPGIELLHANGVIHRDLKPENIMVDQKRGGEATPRVIDFGIAKFIPPVPGAEAILGGTDTRQPNITAETGVQSLTPGYAPPEAYQLGAVVDHRVDIYALGVILYEMVTGRRPFEAETIPALLYAMGNRPRTFEHPELGFGSAQKLYRLIASCTAFHSEQRPATVRLIHDSLREIEKERQNEQRTLARRVRAQTNPVPVPPVAARPRQNGHYGVAQIEKDLRNKTFNRAIIIAAAVCLLVAGMLISRLF